MDAAESFSYSFALSGRRIRLIRILPASGSKPIRISLCQEELDSDTSFLALSYVWGSPDVTETVICNGQTLKITENLHAALWQMREDGRQGYIWADAICINQADTIEKTEQVRMMGDIYKRAEMVLVWLGKEEHNDHHGYSLMVDLCDKIQEPLLGYAAHLPNLASLALYLIPPEAWHGMINLLRRPWFWRAWVLQEYHLARKKTFQCGERVMDPEIFFAIARRLARYPELGGIALMRCPHIRESRYPGLSGPFFTFTDSINGDQPLYRLLSVNRGLQSSDKRDRVFALVGLSSDSDLSMIDYSQDIQDVLVRLAMKTMQKLLETDEPSTALDILCLASLNSDLEDLPSWVPSFETPLAFKLLTEIFPMECPLTTVPKISFGENHVSTFPEALPCYFLHQDELEVEGIDRLSRRLCPYAGESSTVSAKPSIPTLTTCHKKFLMVPILRPKL